MSEGTTTITLYLTVTSEEGQPRVPLELSKQATCSELRRLASLATNIPAATLKLIYRGRLIADSNDKLAVEEFKLESESVLHCMGKPIRPNDTTAPAPTTTTTASSTAVPRTPSVVPAPTAAASAGPVPVTLDGALARLRQQNDAGKYQTAVQTLSKILDNIIQNPMEEKYRRVKKNNAAFQKRLGGLPGAEPVLLAAGFVLEVVEAEPAYVLHASPEAWPGLLQAQSAVQRAVQQATVAASAPVIPPSMGMMAGGMPPLSGAADPMAAMQASMAANIMSDPAALQNMLQNPMIQEMMRADPRMAQMQPMIQELANNPAMARQLSQMMQNPAMQQELQQAMMQHGAAAGLPNNFGAGLSNNNIFMPPTVAGGGSTANNTNRSDDELTEEEMIAEAIRRSLQDGNN